MSNFSNETLDRLLANIDSANKEKSEFFKKQEEDKKQSEQLKRYEEELLQNRQKKLEQENKTQSLKKQAQEKQLLNKKAKPLLRSSSSANSVIKEDLITEDGEKKDEVGEIEEEIKGILTDMSRKVQYKENKSLFASFIDKFK